MNFIEAAFRIRLYAARKLRRTLHLISSSPGVENCAFVRGDGVAFLMSENVNWDPWLALKYRRHRASLPFGVGATTLRENENWTDALARAECAVALTKVASPDTIHSHYVHFDRISAEARHLVDVLHQGREQGRTKATAGLVPYLGLLRELDLT